MTRSSPLARAGFSILEASSAPPLAAPAPITEWISSINKMACFCLPRALRTALNLSSKSPRYFVPASSPPISSEKISESRITSGTSASIIFSAKPSAIAVLPTPASPIKRGLFFLLRQRIWMARVNSRSRPINGSIFPCLARSLRLTVNRCSGSVALSLPSWSFPPGCLISGSGSFGWPAFEIPCEI